MKEKNGASEGIRTLDIHVGNVTLYQTELRSLPKTAWAAYGTSVGMQAVFWQSFGKGNKGERGNLRCG